MTREQGSQAERSLAEVAQQRICQWEAAAENLAKGPGRQQPLPTHAYVAISREAGAGGSEVARRLGELLGWELLDRELLKHMADHYPVTESMLEPVDEKSPSWLSESLGKWLDPESLTQWEYVPKLIRFVHLAARACHCIFVGRGCHFMLPADAGLSVYIRAPLAMRVARVARRRGLSQSEAESYVREVDQERRSFYWTHFHKQMGDPAGYDMTLNLEWIDTDLAARLLANHVRLRFPDAAIRRA